MLGPPPSGAESLLRHLGRSSVVDGRRIGDGGRAVDREPDVDRGPALNRGLPGTCGESAGIDDETLVAAATALRQFHDAQTGYDPPPTATWSAWFADWPARTRPVICHNEFGPAHALRRPDGTLTMVDFGLVAPGPRLLDVAYSAWAWVLLTGEDRSRRLRLFSDVYGLSVTQRSRLVRAIRRRIVMHIAILRHPSFAGAAWRPLVRTLRTLDLEWHLLDHALD
jgi:aminoglycoside phosphotransferase (APT) family kinase protein